MAADRLAEHLEVPGGVLACAEDAAGDDPSRVVDPGDERHDRAAPLEPLVDSRVTKSLSA